MKKIDLKNFYVITPIFNPFRYRSRYQLYQEFRERVLCAGANLVTIECAFANRPYELDDGNVRVRSPYELWLKENLINVAISRLPEDWQYVAWVDADIQFSRPNWVEETVQLLQHYHFLQMFSEVVDLGPKYEYINRRYSFAQFVAQGWDLNSAKGDYSSYGGAGHNRVQWASGFAWAAGRTAIDRVGGLIDWAILGSGDFHMAKALIGMADSSMPPVFRKTRYYEKIMDWQERACTLIKENVGVMPGTIVHYFHGKRANRKYISRWKILHNNKYNPDRDLKRDSQGVWQLVNDGSPRLIKLRDEIRRYFIERDEDSTEV